TVTGSIADGDPTMSDRIFRLDPPSACASSRPCFVVSPTGLHRYDTYTFLNGPAPACMTVPVTTPSTGMNTGNPIQAVAYLGSFNPGSLCMNLLGDIGNSPLANTPKSFSFNVPANANFDVVVHESLVRAGCPNYTATFSGLVCGASGNGECDAG